MSTGPIQILDAVPLPRSIGGTPETKSKACTYCEQVFEAVRYKGRMPNRCPSCAAAGAAAHAERVKVASRKTVDLSAFALRSTTAVARQLQCTKQRVCQLEFVATRKMADHLKRDKEFVAALRGVSDPKSPTRSYVVFGGHVTTPEQRRLLSTMVKAVRVLREEGCTEEARELELELENLRWRISSIVHPDGASIFDAVNDKADPGGLG